MITRSFLFKLALLLCLSIGQLTAIPLWAQSQDTLQTADYSPTHLTVASPEAYREIYLLATQITEHKLLYKYLNEQFKPLRQIPEFLQKEYGWPAESKGLSTTQIMFLLQRYPNYWDELRKYMDTVTEENLNEPKIKAFRESLREGFNSALTDKEAMEKFVRLNMATEPLEIKLGRGQTAFGNVEIVVSFPYYENPEDIKNSKVIPAGDMKGAVVKVIRGAQKTLDSNVFEFNLVEVAQEFIDANDRGITVNLGIDASTIEISEANKAVYAMLVAQMKKSKNFNVVAVDSVGLNHPKLLVADAGEKTAKTVFSSGNFTQSCIGPEGDQVGVEAEKRSPRSKPNHNHLLIVDGALPALVTQMEIYKSLSLKYRGREFPISGAYFFKGPVEAETGKPAEIILAFSPNGGLGELNDLIARIILSSKEGDILQMQFAFSNEKVVSAFQNRILNMFKKGKGPGYKGFGDPPFAMQFWSGFLSLAGLKVNKDLEIYEVDKENPLVKELTPAQLKALQSQIRINPKVYGNFKEKMADGTVAEFSVKVHDKTMANLLEGWAVAGTSFNTSASAENNQEQLLFIRLMKVVRILAGAYMYEHVQAERNQLGYSVVHYANLRNQRKVEFGEVSGAEAKAALKDIADAARKKAAGAPGSCKKLVP
jgi:hypothetical protein